MFVPDPPEEIFALRAPWQPVPDIHAEPVEQLLAALKPGRVALLLCADESIPDSWLNADRIEMRLRDVLMEPVQTQIWPLLTRVWAIGLSGQGAIDSPLNTLHIHSLCHALAEYLDREWTLERSAPAALLPNSLTLETDAPFPLPAMRPVLDSDPMLAFTVTPVASMSFVGEIQDNIAELNALLEIIVKKQLHTQFQPIVSLRDGQVLGYEALIRGPKQALLRRPGAMFHAADKARMVSWFDLACQEQCFRQAAEHRLRHLLFVNMDAEGLAFLNLHERPLAMRAREYGLPPANIVIEITERQTIGDFPRLLSDIERLREEGFKIAIDDAGAGYNSLHVIAELRPEFVKIDRALVRNIDVHGEKRALLAALAQYARHIGTAALAEGSETREELATLIDLGIPYGQGYLLGRPTDDLRGVPRHTREFIQQRARQSTLRMAGREMTVGSLGRKGLAMPPDTPLGEAAEKFARDLSLTSVVVVEEQCPRGLVMREQLEHVLDMAKAAHVAALLPSESIAQWMHTNLLFADEAAWVSEIARQATTRTDLRLDADIVIVRNGKEFVGVLPARDLMEAAITLRTNRQRYADPLTGLPGRVILEQILRERLTARRSLAVIRADINRFGLFNQRVGVTTGDEVILALVHLLEEVASSRDDERFLAHLGGDDLFLLTEAGAATEICHALIQGFEKIVLQFHTAEQVRQGFMEMDEGHGTPRRAPLLSLAVAAQTNQKGPLNSYGQVMNRLQELLRSAKAQPGSHYLIDAA